MEESDSEMEDNNLSGIYSDDEILTMVGLKKLMPTVRLTQGAKQKEANPTTKPGPSRPRKTSTPEPLLNDVDWPQVIQDATIVFAEDIRPSCAAEQYKEVDMSAIGLDITNTTGCSAIAENLSENDEGENDEAQDPDYDPVDKTNTDEGGISDSDGQSGQENEGEETVRNNDSSSDDVDMNESRKRKRKGRSEEGKWKRNNNKELRMLGKAYLGFSRPAGQITKHDTEREARIMKPTCESRACMKSKVRFCSGFSEDVRKDIFEKFWMQMNWDQRKVFVNSHVDYVETKRKTSANDISRRKGSYSYSLHLGAEKKSVCKTMFTNTLSIGQWTVHNWAIEDHGMNPSSDIVNTSRREENPPRNNTLQAQRVFLKTFLDSLAKMPSHYCRKDTAKLYLEPGMFHSKSDVYREYTRRCHEEQVKELSRFTFDESLIDNNLAIFVPRKDLCDTCCEHAVGNLTDEDYAVHISKKDRARQEKEDDKAKAIRGECHVFTMDLQAVKLAPCLKASALYYKTKLCVHNFTVYNLGCRHVTNFIWNESEGGLVSSVFATCVIDYLTEHHAGDNVPIILYSDGCTYQNRNAVMSNALISFSIGHNVIVEQKILEKGHTQMECDSVHSALETKLKNRDIHLPTDYIAVSNEARKPKGNVGRYVTKYLTHDFFKDFSNKDSMRYQSIRPGRIARDAVVTDIRALRYHPTGLIQVKLDFNEEWQDLPRRPKPVPEGVEFPALYKEPLKITSVKYGHLQQLKAVLPEYCHSFYDDLPRE